MRRTKRVFASIDQVRKSFRASLATARNIAATYAAARDSGNTASKASGKRQSKQILVPPFQRPEARLMQEILQLARDIHFHRILNKVKDHVRERDHPFRHKPRGSTPVDWAIRLVDRVPRQKRSALGVKDEGPLLDPSFASRLATELNFAWQYEIDSWLVASFVDFVGGHKAISALEKAGGLNLSEEPWLELMQAEDALEQCTLLSEDDDAWEGMGMATSTRRP